MSKTIPSPLFVFEMANNHMGNVSHGIELINRFGEVSRGFPEFSFAFKLQYRQLDSFIHPAMRGRDDIKYIKRFSETRLSREDFDQLIDMMRKNNFLTMCTPFDEPSVDVIEEQGLDIIKIASCSFTDWPLLERVVQSEHPIIASTAGASLNEIDRVVSFFTHRQKQFALLHCVGEYPTADQNMHIGQIDVLKARYPGVNIGFSTHEDPSHTDMVKLALAKGATIFEKHVGLPTEQYPLNAYSANPDQVKAWLKAARETITMCGESQNRLPVNQNEAISLRSLRRGIFANREIQTGEIISEDDVYFAFPPEEGQFTTNDWSKYASFIATTSITADRPITPANTKRNDVRSKVWQAAQQVKQLLATSGILIPGGVKLELSHHYGIDRFTETGLSLITVVNRGYCKKLLVSLPGQLHPEQYHKQKEESFCILYGEVNLTLNGQTSHHKPGDIITIEPGVKHSWVSSSGVIIEEISSTHYSNDSFYTDDSINLSVHRKTILTYWMN